MMSFQEEIIFINKRQHWIKIYKKNPTEQSKSRKGISFKIKNKQTMKKENVGIILRSMGTETRMRNGDRTIMNDI